MSGIVDIYGPAEVLMLMQFEREDLSEEQLVLVLDAERHLSAIRTEDPQAFAALHLYFVSDYQQQAVAQILGVNQATISRKLKSGLRFIASHMGLEYEPESL